MHTDAMSPQESGLLYLTELLKQIRTSHARKTIKSKTNAFYISAWYRTKR
jgi:hypothetical protein